MPGESGISLCERLRQEEHTNQIPLIMMTARNARDVRVNAFSSGADDFLEKPFYMDELLARIDSKIRRSNEKKIVSGTTLTYNDISLDLEKQRMTVSGESVDVGQIEFKLICHMLRRPGELVVRKEVENLIWGDDRPQTRSLDTHIGGLRKKLKSSSVEIRTIYHQGYILQNKTGSVRKELCVLGK